MCRSATECDQCVNSWLVVDSVSKKCTCNVGNFTNMLSDERGSCVCQPGYFLTINGCSTCQQLIPGCNECYETSSNTGVELFTNATASTHSIVQRPRYLDCRTCKYGTYKVRANSFTNTTVACPTCDSAIIGCSDCGSTGFRCYKCLNTHVFTSTFSKQPCVPCGIYMKGCVWCRSPSDCVKFDNSLL